MLRDLLAGIGILFASLFGGAHSEPTAAADPIPVHPQAVEIAGVAAAPAAASPADQGLAFATTGIPAPVASPPPSNPGISPAVLTASLAALRSEFLAVSATGVSDTFLRLQVDRIYDSIEVANRGIDQRIASLSAADIAGLDSLAYLPSTGGSLSGSLSLSDTLSIASTTAGHFFTVTLDGTTSLLSVRASTTPGLSSPNHAMIISNRSTIDGAWAGILFQSNEGADNRRAQIKAGRDTTASVDGLGSGVGYLAFTTRATGGTSGFAQGFAERLRITGPGKVGIGTTSPTAWLDVVGKSGNTASLQVSPLLQLSTVNPSSAYATTTHLIVTNLGNVGVATTSPWRTLSVIGTVGFDGLTAATGAGSLCLSASNEVVTNAGSDACLPSVRATKHDITGLDLDALATVLALEPVSFVYNDSDGRTRYGFIAEDTATILAPLATYAASTTVSGIDDRAVLAVVVKAIQSLWASLTDRLTDHERRIADLEAELAALPQGAPSPSRSAEEDDAPVPAADESSDTAPTNDLAHASSTPASETPGGTRTPQDPGETASSTPDEMKEQGEVAD